jgi:hypothetical protein
MKLDEQGKQQEANASHARLGGVNPPAEPRRRADVTAIFVTPEHCHSAVALQPRCGATRKLQWNTQDNLQ